MPRMIRVGLVTTVALTLLALFVPSAWAVSTTRASLATSGAQGNGPSITASISENSALVAFASTASNLVAGDANGASDIFVRDRTSGQTTRVSKSSSGAGGNAGSFSPSISADGRFVAFASDATNLVPGDTNGVRDIFVFDRSTGQTTMDSRASDGTPGNDSSFEPSISQHGRWLAFSSNATNLQTALDNNGARDIFFRDRNNGTTRQISRSSDGTLGNAASSDPSISAGGHVVAFTSLATNLVGDTNGVRDIFVRDIDNGLTNRVNRGPGGAEANGNSFEPSTSSDGRYVAFSSDATNLVSGDTNGVRDVFMRDREGAATTRVSKGPNGAQSNGASAAPSISSDGRFVAYQSFATNLVSGDSNGVQDIFVRDRQAQVTSLASRATNQTQGNGPSTLPSTADGRFVAFQSTATNLVPSDTNGVSDVFVRDQQ